MPDSHTSAASPELLAPAGDRQSLVAAVRNGADAVYLGLENLNARRGAANFTLDELAGACDFAHLRGARVYLTANVLVLPQEMPGAVDLVCGAWDAGVDAVIVQDLGLLSRLREQAPDIRLHSSTQIGAHNVPTVEVLRDLGVSRVTLARELSVGEISVLASVAGVEVECFAHGALCMSYSGQCLLSSMVGGRSANRGMCAQPCRLAYQLRDSAGPVETDGSHLLSPRDLAAAGRLRELVDAGVDALKIEGRMKSPEYVALVTGVYREALDRAAADPGAFAVTDGEWSVLEEAFNRGFTDGYLAGRSDSTMMARRRPNNRGVRVGRVASVGKGPVVVALERAIDSGDELEFWTARGRHAQKVGTMTADGRRLTSAPAGADVQLEVTAPVAPGDRVFRVANAALLEAARRTFARADEPRPVPVDFTVEVIVGEPLVVEARADGATGRAEGPRVEAARTKSITADEIMQHVDRLGGTPYEAAGWDIRLDATAGLGYSQLHRTRREALEALDAARLDLHRERRSSAAGDVLGDSSTGGDTATRAAARPVSPADGGRVELVALVASEDAARQCLAAGAERILLAVETLDAPRALGSGVEPLLPRIAHDHEIERHLAWAESAGACAAGNIGALAVAVRAGATVEADWATNATNVAALGVLADLGASAVWLSPELTLEQTAEVAAGSPIPVGMSVLGAQELMVTESCVLQAAGECDRACDPCSRRAEDWLLEDRKGYSFPVRSDAMGRSHVFNARPLDLTHALDEVIGTGIAMVRLDLTLYGPEEAAVLTSRVRERLDASRVGPTPGGERILEPSTTGHAFRGVS